MNGRKRVKTDESGFDREKFKQIYSKICKASLNNQEHPFQNLMRKV